MDKKEKAVIRKLKALRMRLDLLAESQGQTTDKGFESIKAIVEKQWDEKHKSVQIVLDTPPNQPQSKIGERREYVKSYKCPTDRSSNDLKTSDASKIKAVLTDKHGRKIVFGGVALEKSQEGKQPGERKKRQAGWKKSTKLGQKS